MVAVIVFVVGLVYVQNFEPLAAAAEEDEDVAPPLIYNIQVSGVSATSSVITWDTDEVADSLINFGLDKEYGIVRDPRADKVEHMIILENLLADSLYYFRITSSDENGNQGISSDFTFVTKPDYIELTEEHGLAEQVLEEGEGGLSEKGLEKILQAIESITSEEVLEEIEEKIKEKAEEVVTPPTIILDMADVEVGTNYAIIPWETDKESNTIVALAEEDDYDPDRHPEDPPPGNGRRSDPPC